MLCFSACASTGGKEPKETGHVTGSYDAPVVADQTETQEESYAAEAIKLPSAQKSKSYFAKISDDIVKNVEKGSPSSIA